MKTGTRVSTICLLTAAVSLCGSWARPGKAETTEASDLQVIRRTGKLTMLCWPHQESSYVRRMVEEYGEEGLKRFTGIDVEILRGFAKSLGVELEVRPMTESFGQLIPSLLAKDGHVIGSSLTITERRSEKVDFSMPYQDVELFVISRRENKLDSVADFAGRTAAVVAGSSHEEHLLALGLEDLRLLHTLFVFESYTEVAEGRADFTLVDSGSVGRVLEENSELAKVLDTAFIFPREDGYGFAVNPGSDLLAPLNAYLEDLRASGELDRVKARFLPSEDRPAGEP